MKWNKNSKLPLNETVLAQLHSGQYVCVTWKDKTTIQAEIYRYTYINETTTIHCTLDSIRRWTKIEE